MEIFVCVIQVQFVGNLWFQKIKPLAQQQVGDSESVDAQKTTNSSIIHREIQF